MQPEGIESRCCNIQGYVRGVYCCSGGQNMVTDGASSLYIDEAHGFKHANVCAPISMFYMYGMYLLGRCVCIVTCYMHTDAFI